MHSADDRLYLLLALFDVRDGSPLGDLVRAAREGFERSHPDMGADENRHAWDEFDRLWDSYDQQERLALTRPLFSQPVPGNSGGEEAGRCRVCLGPLEGAPGPECDDTGCPERDGSNV